MNFERGKNPKEALNIGLYTYREFEDDMIAAFWVVRHLPAILGTEDIPEDIFGSPLGDQGYNTAYNDTIRDYVMMYISSLEGGPLPPNGVRKFPDASLMYIISDMIQHGLKKDTQ